MRKLESQFGIGFRKTKPTSESEKRKSVFLGIFRDQKKKHEIFCLNVVCLLTKELINCNFQPSTEPCYNEIKLNRNHAVPEVFHQNCSEMEFKKSIPQRKKVLERK